MKSSRALLAWWVLLLPVAAQEVQPSAGELRESLQALEERGRDELHPAEDPLVIVGREQGDNDLRSRTPALARSDRVAARVDPEEAYARALALYEGGETFHAPPRSVGGEERDASARERAAARRKGAVEASAPQEEESGGTWGRVGLILAGMVTLLVLYRRFAQR
jgi:hypothetical protein